MLFVYRILINLIFFFSPLLLIFRLLKKKESLKRFKEKYCFFSKERKEGNLVWFHGASVGELYSIIPLVERLEKDKKVKQILITSNTLSSSKIMEKFKFKKLVHQFFPIDTNFLNKRFINYWKPNSAFFIDSEIWPNIILNLKKKQVPVILLNARITKKTFNRWKALPNLAKKIFNNFDLCLSSNKESKKYLNFLGAKKIKLIGNLKYSQLEKERIYLHKDIKEFIQKKKVLCISSTHDTEEFFFGLIHKELKKKYKNLLTIIIPRHIERFKKIKESLENLGLTTHVDVPKSKIKKNTDIYIVNSYGKTKSFYNHCTNVFLGGSLINHGGQNPLEASRFGCNILHGPNVSNFSEIYKFLKKNKISSEVKNQKQVIEKIDKFFKKKTNSNFIKRKLNLIGQKILNKTYKEIKSYL